MGKCNQCKIEVLDDVPVCPLCKCVLDYTGEHENMYPNIRRKDRKLGLLTRIYLFLILLIEGLLIYVNYLTFHGIWWSAITGGAFAYGLLTLKFAVQHNAGHKSKLIIQTLCGIGYVILIDFILGFRGWSLNYVLPAGTILLDASIVILMFINIRNWQSYMLFQLFMIVWSILPIVFYRYGLLTSPLLSVIAFITSICLFVGTFIIGGRRASTELKRRFHVR